MVLNYEYSKDALPKKSDYAYPVKKTDIDNILIEVGVTELGDISFSTGKRTDYTEGYPVFVALLPGESHKGRWSKSTPLLTVHAVPKEHLDRIRSLINEKKILHKIMDWLVSLETASNVVRDIARKRGVIFLDDNLIVFDENSKKVGLP